MQMFIESKIEGEGERENICKRGNEMLNKEKWETINDDVAWVLVY